MICSLIYLGYIWLTIFACPALSYRTWKIPPSPFINTSVDWHASDLWIILASSLMTCLTFSESWVWRVPFKSKWKRCSYAHLPSPNLTCITTVWSEVKTTSFTWCLSLTGSKSRFLLPGEGMIVKSNYLPLSLTSTNSRFVDPVIACAIAWLSVLYTLMPVLMLMVFWPRLMVCLDAWNRCNEFSSSWKPSIESFKKVWIGLLSPQVKWSLWSVALVSRNKMSASTPSSELSRSRETAMILSPAASKTYSYLVSLPTRWRE